MDDFMTKGLFVTDDLKHARCVVRISGVYKQVNMARRGDQLFICAKGGFVPIFANGKTSFPSIEWDFIDGINYKAGKLNRLFLTE